ncbi:MAG TPA: glutathione S-transferase family protein [Caulobacteraceae bacterium]
MLTLYFAPGSSSMAPHVALHEIGAPFEPRPLSFHNRETRTPEFLAINPAGKVPVLAVDGRPISEVLAILVYLARAYPEAGLLPDDPVAEGQVLALMSFLASTVHPVRKQGLGVARATYQMLDDRLGDADWAVGGRYSIADIHLFRLFWRFRGSLEPAPGAFANLTRHYDRMMARPAVKKTIEIESAIGYQLPA